jgi:hypothetical protein
MPTLPVEPAEAARRLDALRAAKGNISHAARALGLPRATLAGWLNRGGRQAREAAKLPPRVRSGVQRWLLTGAQDDTAVHTEFWANLNAFAGHIGAAIRVGGSTYQKGLFEDHATRTAVFAPEVRPHMDHENEMLGPFLWAAKMNILPTAERPLTGLHTYSRGAWAAFPHAKTQMVSVPALQGEHPAHIFTTGFCTVPNYVEKKAGLKAEFHHTIGALLVEVDSAGLVFCRQIGAVADGSFQDLDVQVSRGQVTTGHRIEHLTAGDIHREQVDPDVVRAIWGYDIDSDAIVTTDTLFHTLRPRSQAIHDLLDFQARNHHRRNDPHFWVKMWAERRDSVEQGIRNAARFLRMTAADWCTTAVIASNHNEALLRWLKEADPRVDPVNMGYWCQLNAEIHRRIVMGDDEFDVFKWALEQHDAQRLNDIKFIPRDGSFVVCEQAGGIECALHGDKGTNGARGGAQNLSRIARKVNVGDAHTPAILDGVFVAGLCGLLDQGYNVGPSGWSHTQIVTYPNGKRTLVTLREGKWRA